MAAKQEAEQAAAKSEGGGKKKLLLILLPVVLLIGGGAGLWFTGILPGLLGMHPPPPPSQAQAAADSNAPAPAPPARPPVFFDMPDITTNLNAPGRRAAFIRVRSKLEITRAEDATALTAAMPRLVDLFQTYLREMRPEELRGSAGTHRLREELIARANIAAHPVRVQDVLFVEIIVQ